MKSESFVCSDSSSFGKRSTFLFLANLLNTRLNIGQMSSSQLFTIRLVSLSQSTGTVTRSSKLGSVVAYASLKNWKPLIGSVDSNGSPGGISPDGSRNAQPFSSRIGSTTVMPMVSSSPFNFRKMTVRLAHGQANETYR